MPYARTLTPGAHPEIGQQPCDGDQYRLLPGLGAMTRPDRALRRVWKHEGSTCLPLCAVCSVCSVCSVCVSGETVAPEVQDRNN